MMACGPRILSKVFGAGRSPGCRGGSWGGRRSGYNWQPDDRGKRADRIVLDEDVFTCDETHIKAVVPTMTMIGGGIIFEGDDAERRQAT